ncbi:hypothetical protein FHS26_004424 [Rhizobium pisi]|uniref:Uncharacterized protein n=1 Tax=Rhizobium pisi TaxID=574561 RepID=A0A7W5G189_9HYPH|nr:hypothetical protein [Rhizobium pisi]
MRYHLILLTTPIVRHCLTEGSRLRWQPPEPLRRHLRSSAEVADPNGNAAKVHIARRCPPTCAGAEAQTPLPALHPLNRAGRTDKGREDLLLALRGILSEVKLSTEITRAVAGKTIWQIRIGADSPATTGVLPQRFFQSSPASTRISTSGSAARCRPIKSRQASEDLTTLERQNRSARGHDSQNQSHRVAQTFARSCSIGGRTCPNAKNWL